jgi:hypothetical protein
VVDGVHGAALMSLLGSDLFASPVFDLKVKAPQFPAKAKSVIHLFMNGGPSQVDLFDSKPALKRLAGSAPSRELSFAISNGKDAGTLYPSPFEFKPRGKSGIEISDALPHLAECVDDIALIRSMYGEHANHEPALFLMHTGRTIASRPSIGAWVAYGLGTENQNLPAYVVLDDPKGLPINGISNWQSAFLPPIYQGTRFRTEGAPVLNLEPRPEVPAPLMEAERNLLHKLDEMHRAQRQYQPELDARISSYELAARMQMAASDALDLTKESEATREAYGLNDAATASYGKRCLMARRLVERGVRFVQLYIESQIFDTHSNLHADLTYACTKTDKPVAALLKDLKQRGCWIRHSWYGAASSGGCQYRRARRRWRDGTMDQTGSACGWPAAARRAAWYTARRTISDSKRRRIRLACTICTRPVLHLLGLNNRELFIDRNGLKERLTDQYPARVVSEIIG